MKRIIIILVIAFLCTGLMQAQTKILGRKVFDRGIQSHTFIPKGQWMVGSTFSYSEHEDDNYKFLVLEKIESTGYTFKVSPSSVTLSGIMLHWADVFPIIVLIRI